MLSLSLVLRYYLVNYLLPDLSGIDTLALAESGLYTTSVVIGESEQHAGYNILVRHNGKMFSRLFAYAEIATALIDEDRAQQWAQNVYFPWLEENLRTKKRTLVRMVV